MNKIYLGIIPFKLTGNIIEKGQKLEFKANNLDDRDFKINESNGFKVLSIFPDINTKICDLQTRKIHKLSKEYININFISISNDSIEKQSKWCIANDKKDLDIVSDLKYGEFAEKTNLYIKKIGNFHRGFIILDENNIVLESLFNSRIDQDPNYDKLEEWLKKTSV